MKPTLVKPILIAVIVAVGSSTLLAQAKAPKKDAAAAAQPAQPAPAKPGPPLPAPPADFQYTPEGRRDPFISLVNRGTEAKTASGMPATKRPDGVAGLDAGQLVVRGIMHSRGAYLAMVNGADGKVYTVRAGDRLFDGVVRAVTPQAVVILQEVNDPLSLEKQREVRKFLRGGDEVK